MADSRKEGVCSWEGAFDAVPMFQMQEGSMNEIYRFNGCFWDAENSMWVARMGKYEAADSDLHQWLQTETGEQLEEVKKALAALPDRAPTPAEIKAGCRAVKYSDD